MNEITLPVLITGCDRGLGRKMAVYLAKKRLLLKTNDSKHVYGRIYVLAACYQPESLGFFSQHGEGRVRENTHAFVMDVTCELSVSDAYRCVCEVLKENVCVRMGDIDMPRHSVPYLYGLLSNSGIMLAAYTEMSPLEWWDKSFAVNVHGAYRVVQTFLPLLQAFNTQFSPSTKIDRHIFPRVLLIGSVVGTVGLPGASAYSASKFGVRGLAEGLAEELKGCGVGVILAEPGGTRTDLYQSLGSNASINRIEEELSSSCHVSVSRYYGVSFHRRLMDRMVGFMNLVANNPDRIATRLADTFLRDTEEPKGWGVGLLCPKRKSPTPPSGVVTLGWDGPLWRFLSVIPVCVCDFSFAVLCWLLFPAVEGGVCVRERSKKSERDGKDRQKSD
eukprot:GDKI01047137.1.p1 GENE.GDKI01047137.1~~GDKI01047137.1.p1  ORF type:complete len:389 (+),score=77.45 GDKI01047137.1:199-1365(+)